MEREEVLNSVSVNRYLQTYITQLLFFIFLINFVELIVVTGLTMIAWY